MKTLVKLLFLASVASSLMSCSSRIHSPRLTNFNSNDSEQSLTINSGTSVDTTVPEESSPGHYILKSNRDYYLVTQQQPGHLRNAFPIFRMINYEREYNLPELYRIPSFEEFSAKNLEITLVQADSVKLVEHNYRSTKHYLSGTRSDQLTRYKASHFDPANIVGETLNLFGFSTHEVDSMAKLEDTASLKFSVSVVHLTAIQSDEDILWRLEINTDWSWTDRISGEERSKFLHTESFWSSAKASDYLGAETKRMQHEQLAHAIAKALIDLSNMKSFEPEMSKAKYLRLQESEWSPLTVDIAELTETPTKISEATKSVVTLYNKYGHGSGCVISHDGYIVTNYHVVESEPKSSFIALFASGEELPVKVVRSNKYSDLVLLKVEAKNLFSLELANDVMVGEKVYAIGTPADISFGQSVSSGIISAHRNTDGERSIQTDAKVSPGNSGGALINADGKLVGIIRMKIIGNAIEGLGFAIPVEDIQSSLMLEFE